MDKKGIAVALGTFDGLHIGHKAVLSAALKFTDCDAVAVTFGEPPKRHTSGEFVPMLMTAEEKNRALREMGFSAVDVLDYDKVRDIPARDFLDMLFEKYDIKAVTCGFNYRFGAGGSGDAALLTAYCHEHKAEAVVCPASTVSGQTVSSTLIRELISDGKIPFANTLLGRHFSISGKVIHGDARGRTIGFPTVNQLLDPEIVTPLFGVYATAVTVGGRMYPAVTNIGIRPTFLLQKPMSETNIIGFEGDLYGDDIRVELLSFLRPETRFDGMDQLKAAIANDAEAAKAAFAAVIDTQKKN